AGQERDDALALLEKCRAEYLAIARAKAREIAVKTGRVTVDDVRAAERFDREKELRLAGGTDYDASQPLLHPGHSRYAIGSGDG
ncbi:MAG: hypothetical protein EBT13_17070, partial [Rhodobacteraceae bacterium]|nr:hypothetical protein [Paracoccaceae bacterium]